MILDIMLGLGGSPSSYIRSGFNAASRTHSQHQYCYVLPSPHSHSSLYYNHAGLSPLHSHLQLPHQAHDPMNGAAPVPTYDDLKRHYDELMDQQKKVDEMSEKNQRMIAGVKRSLVEMQRGGGNGARESDRPCSAQSVWPLETTQRK